MQGARPRVAKNTFTRSRTKRACSFCAQRKVRCRPSSSTNQGGTRDATCLRCIDKGTPCSLQVESIQHRQLYLPDEESQGIPAFDLRLKMREEAPGTALVLKPRIWTPILPVPDTTNYPAHKVNGSLSSAGVQGSIHPLHPRLSKDVDQNFPPQGTTGSYSQCVYGEYKDPNVENTSK